MTWNVAVPADTDPIRQGASAIRSIEVDLTTALTTEGIFPGATPATPVFRWKPRVGNTGSRPANDNVNPGTVYYNTDLNEWELDSGTAWTPLVHLIPPGVVQAYMGTSVPAGWLFCNGSAVSRTTYAALFAAIGVSCGSGDGATTFNLPDLRGQFLRGVDGGVGRDPDTGTRTAMNPGGNTGDTVGSVQADVLASHNHTVTDPGHLHVKQYGTPGGGDNNFVENPSGSGAPSNTQSATTGITLGATGGSETRPKNAYVNFIIKT
jgi:microcystin-dependent protein